jgi:branched-chain amino acid transport system substrate-binding protein
MRSVIASKRRVLQAIAACAGLFAAGITGANAQETIKIGIVGPFTGPFATTGAAFRQGLEAYLAIHGATAGGRRVEVLYRDSSANPALAKSLTEELLIKDKVAILGGYMLTPEAAAIAPLANEAKVPVLLFNAATPALLGMSPFFLRMGQNITQPAELGAVYARQNNKRRGYIAVADYAPGHIVEAAFAAKFAAEGGEIVGKDRIPLNTVDFASFAERIANANPDVLEIFITPGAPAVGFMKALAARGLTKKLLIIGQGEAEDNDLHLFDESVVGFHSILYLSSTIDNAENKTLKAALVKKFGPGTEPSAFTVGAYDGLHVAFRMLETQTGKRFDGATAVKSLLGYSYKSPRGPVTIDPETRENIQNFYVRRVDKQAGKLVNVVIKTFEQVPPPPTAKKL